MLHYASHSCYTQQFKQDWVTLDIRWFSVTLCLVTILVVCGSCTNYFMRHAPWVLYINIYIYIYTYYQRKCKAILNMLCVWVQFQTGLLPLHMGLFLYFTLQWPAQKIFLHSPLPFIHYGHIFWAHFCISSHQWNNIHY